MNLQKLVTFLNSGNIALGAKLSKLLTEDCVILEYTDDSVLFIKGGNLVSAKFKHPMTEGLSADSILSNEVLSISARELNVNLRKKLSAVIEGIISKDYVSAEDDLKSFCETYYQLHAIKAKCPELFVENLVKNNRGFAIRKKAHGLISKFKAEVFTATVVEESIGVDDDTAAYASLVEKYGLVLALGKAKVTSILTEAVLGNSMLAESLASHLYVVAESLGDTNPELDEIQDDGYDLEGGSFPEEGGVSEEDYSADIEPGIDDLEISDAGEEGSEEFQPFDPATLSEEDIKELHKRTLKSILDAIKDFVAEKAGSIEDSNIPADLDETILSDIASLEDPEISDARLSEIEARWQPMIGYFLDSDYHTPESLTDETVDLDETVPAGEDSLEDVDTDGIGDGSDMGDGMGGELPPPELEDEEAGI